MNETNVGMTNAHGSFNDFDPSRVSSNDDWWACPFDPSIAPFSNANEGLSLSLEPDSLDFLWNMGI